MTVKELEESCLNIHVMALLTLDRVELEDLEKQRKVLAEKVTGSLETGFFTGEARQHLKEGQYWLQEAKRIIEKSLYEIDNHLLYSY